MESERILKLRAALAKKTQNVDYSGPGEYSFTTMTMGVNFNTVINTHFFCQYSHLCGGYQKVSSGKWVPNSEIQSEIVGIKYQITMSLPEKGGDPDPENPNYSLVHKTVLLGDIHRVAMKNKKLQHFVMIGVSPYGRKKMNVMLFKKGTATITGCKSREDGFAAAAVIYDHLSYMNKQVLLRKKMHQQLNLTSELSLVSDKLNVLDLKFNLINAQFDSNLKLNIIKFGKLLETEPEISKIKLPDNEDHKLKVYLPMKANGDYVSLFICSPKKNKNSVILINAADSKECISKAYSFIKEILLRRHTEIISLV